MNFLLACTGGGLESQDPFLNHTREVKRVMYYKCTKVYCMFLELSSIYKIKQPIPSKKPPPHSHSTTLIRNFLVFT